MKNERKTKRSKPSFILILTLTFIVLKLTGQISWSWIWVLSPIWITILVFSAAFGFILIGGRVVKGKW